jgi:hypothetical protein
MTLLVSDDRFRTYALSLHLALTSHLLDLPFMGVETA